MARQGFLPTLTLPMWQLRSQRFAVTSLKGNPNVSEGCVLPRLLGQNQPHLQPERPFGSRPALVLRVSTYRLDLCAAPLIRDWRLSLSARHTPVVGQPFSAVGTGVCRCACPYVPSHSLLVCANLA